MAGDWWIIPDQMVERLEERFSKHGKTWNEYWDALQNFAFTQLKNMDVDLAQYYKKGFADDPSTLARALNKKKDNGVFIKKGKHFLHLLCYFAYGADWDKTLLTLGLKDSDIQRRKTSPQPVKPLTNDELRAQFEKQFSPLLARIRTYIFEENIEKVSEELAKAREMAEENNDKYSKPKLDLEFYGIINLYIIINGAQFDYTDADEVLTESLLIFEELGLAYDAGKTKHALACIKLRNGNYIVAEEYAKDALVTNKDLSDTASIYLTTGVIQMNIQQYEKANGYFDEGIKYAHLLIAKKTGDIYDHYYTLACCHANKIDCYVNQGKHVQARSCAIKALQELKKFDKSGKFDLQLQATIMFRLAEIEVYVGNLGDNKWKHYIEEAKRIFIDYENHIEKLRCTDFLAGVALIKGQKELAYSIFSEIADEVDHLKVKERAYFKERRIFFLLHNNWWDEANIYLNELFLFATENDLKKSLAFTYENQACVFFELGDYDNVDKNLNKLVKICEELYDIETSVWEQLNIQRQLANAHRGLGNTYEALRIYQNVIRNYEELGRIDEVVETYLKVIFIKMSLEQYDEVASIYNKLMQLLEGTGFYELQGKLKKGYSELLYRTGDFVKAQQYLEETVYFFEKYKLFYRDEVQLLLDELKIKNTIFIPSVYTFMQLINRLYYDNINRTGPSDETIRYWYSKSKVQMLRIFYNYSGLKSFLFSNNIELCREVAAHFSWLFDFTVGLFDQNEIVGKHTEIMDFPFRSYDAELDGPVLRETDLEINIADFMEENKFRQALKKHISVNMTDQYTLIQKPGVSGPYYACGWKFDLPQHIYSFIQRNVAKDISLNNYFFLPITRYSDRDSRLQDIHLAYQCGFFPVYVREYVHSSNILILHEATIELPFNSLTDSDKVQKTKQLFYTLHTATKENAKSLLAGFKIEIDMLFGKINDRLSVGILLVQFDYHSKKMIAPVIILEPGNTP